MLSVSVLPCHCLATPTWCSPLAWHQITGDIQWSVSLTCSCLSLSNTSETSIQDRRVIVDPHTVTPRVPLGESPRWHGVKESACQCRRCWRHRFHPWVGKIPWRRAGQPTPIFLPGESHGQRSLGGYSLRGHKESDMTERLSMYTHIHASYKDTSGSEGLEALIPREGILLSGDQDPK